MSRTYDVLTGTGPESVPQQDAPRHNGFERPQQAPPVASDGRLEGVPVEQVNLQRLQGLAFFTGTPNAATDRFRFLRLRLVESPQNLKRLLVTSPLPQDGKSTVALNLVTALAEGGKRAVLLIDADLHHSSITRQLGLDHCAGLVECLQAGSNPMAAVRRLEPAAWYFLPAGKPCSDPTDLLQGAALGGVMAELSARFDWIVIDAPPVGPMTDALSLKKEADATLLVVRAGQTPQDDVEQALALLGQKHVFAILLNAVEGMDRLYSKYSKYYRHKREDA